MVGIVGDIVTLPNFGDANATRDWLQGVVAIAESIPQWWIVWPNLCEREADDDMLAFLQQAVRDDGMYDSLYRLLIVCLSTGRELTAEEAALAVRLLADAAKKAGVDPQDVLATMQTIASLVRLIRDSALCSSTY